MAALPVQRDHVSTHASGGTAPPQNTPARMVATLSQSEALDKALLTLLHFFLLVRARISFYLRSDTATPWPFLARSHQLGAAKLSLHSMALAEVVCPPMMVTSQLTLMLAICAMHMMTPMNTAHTHTPILDTITRRLPLAWGGHERLRQLMAWLISADGCQALGAPSQEHRYQQQRTLGLMYRRYTSNVNREDTASISLAPLDVTAMKQMMITRIAPACSTKKNTAWRVVSLNQLPNQIQGAAAMPLDSSPYLQGQAPT